jgi:uncharacterized membrane protein
MVTGCRWNSAVMAPSGADNGGQARTGDSQGHASGSKADPRASTRTHLLIAGMVGIVAAAVMGVVAGWRFAALAGWDAAALVIVVWTWIAIWGRNPEETARLAVRDDPARAVADLLVVAASVASLVGVGFVIVAGSNSKGAAKAALVAFAVLTVIVSWFIVHTTYTLRYARLYYAGTPGGLDFHQEGAQQPQYTDFAYLSLTIGMTFQVSDTEVNSTVMRATILRHALLAYLFGVVIIAIMINLVAGLTK